MRKQFSLLLLFSITFLYSQQNLYLSPQKYNLNSYKTIEKVFSPPEGFQRVPLADSSFGAYLRNLPVVESVAVLTFKDKTIKAADDSTVAGVIPIKIKGRNLWQCMDILQVFHMDYFQSQSRKDEIVYPLPEGTTLSWQEWKSGIRPVFKGLKFIKENRHPEQKPVNLQKSRHPELVSGSPDGMLKQVQHDENVRQPEFISGSTEKNDVIAIEVKRSPDQRRLLRQFLPRNDEKEFRRYCNTIFEHSGTQTFWHYYPDIKLTAIQPGDFITKKGRKGHAVLIVDLAINERGEKVALIGQGDTPACQFYLLQKKGKPWFKVAGDFPDLPIKKKMYWSGLRRF